MAWNNNNLEIPTCGLGQYSPVFLLLGPIPIYNPFKGWEVLSITSHESRAATAQTYKETAAEDRSFGLWKKREPRMKKKYHTLRGPWIQNPLEGREDD